MVNLPEEDILESEGDDEMGPPFHTLQQIWDDEGVARGLYVYDDEDEDDPDDEAFLEEDTDVEESDDDSISRLSLLLLLRR